MADQSSPVGLASKYNFLEATIHRRSTITTKKESPIPDSRIVELVKHSIIHTPSPFHVQSTRAVVLLHTDHDKLWDIAHENVEKTAPPPALYEKLTTSIKLYKGAYGSILFYDDPKAVQDVPAFLANLIKDFPEWSEHTNGIAQYITWTALCAEGLGCSLQHYQKGITERIAAEWDLPAHWDLKAQLVFGTPNGPPRGGENKQFADIEPRVRVFGAQ